MSDHSLSLSLSFSVCLSLDKSLSLSLSDYNSLFLFFLLSLSLYVSVYLSYYHSLPLSPSLLLSLYFIPSLSPVSLQISLTQTQQQQTVSIVVSYLASKKFQFFGQHKLNYCAGIRRLTNIRTVVNTIKSHNKSVR